MPSPGAPNPWSYTRHQRFGLLLLLFLIAGLYWIGHTWSQTTGPHIVADDEALFAAAQRLRLPTKNEGTEPKEEAFRFDPNRVTASELERLGLSARQAAAFIRFRDKHPFRAPEEIGKLYVLQPAQSKKLIALADINHLITKSVNKEISDNTADQRDTLHRQRFTFDPNTLPADSLRLLGFTVRETEALLKYRGYRPLTFRQPEDLLRVRALDSQRVSELLPLIDIALPNSAASASPPVSTPVAVDINTATAEEWAQLPGIGPFRARQIVEFREALGGFARPEQVGETYGLPDSVFTAIHPFLRASPITRPLAINRLEADALARHPLLRKRTAEIIVRYRDNHGSFDSAEDLKNVRALSTETLDALLPYLNFDR
ncbi:helix-hairpin-helix domain-containing protein [Lewinella sp. JB7]|uniref:ComEA family DNA-binding protein n=1 Tax=Lewinella sp. JB7 TaxID=2962887 RepID=UPI0020C9C386|nr:helix-hairpin-helix domain-containing protein [Lewinella sp. JB7]MCP9235027.1 helix-hairpin-helix domain-containing protein [Lewinella sp. JB7]